jgi:hypothetical protein
MPRVAFWVEPDLSDVVLNDGPDGTCRQAACEYFANLIDLPE